MALAVITTVIGMAAILSAQDGLNPAKLLNPGTDSWPTYNGDYSGRRFSTLKAVDAANVKTLSLAWLYTIPAGGPIKSTPLMIDGILYFSTPDHAYAVSARTGREIWHYVWPSKGGNHLGNRGMAALADTLYFETPDCHLVALEMKTGEKKWDKEICDMNRFYYASVAPVIVKNQVIAGVSGDDMDNPGYVEAHDPVTGEMKWRWYTVPQKMGESGSETWPNEEVMKHGGGMTWMPVTYDPELNLIFVTTGNPQPVIAHKNRSGDNLFTGSIVALDGRHREGWSGTSRRPRTTLTTGTRRRRRCSSTERSTASRASSLAQASRNGHFFVLDRTDGKSIVSSEFVKTNWSLGYDKRGQPIPNPAKMPQIDGALVSPNSERRRELAIADVQPDDRALLRQRDARLQRVLHLRSERQPGRLGRLRSRRLLGGDAAGHRLQDRQDPLEPSLEERRSPPVSSAPQGISSSRGGSGGLEALNATTGEALWHARIGTVTQRTDHLRAGWRAAHRRRLGQQRRGVRDEQVGRGFRP